MKRCVRCWMPDTRPGTIFNEEGVCGACLNYENRQWIDWTDRRQKLVELCNRYRRYDGSYDCIIPVSGGKDSHFQAHVMKKQLRMNPLLVTVGNPFAWTKAGWHNFTNIGNAFGCDHYLFNMSADMLRRAMRVGLEELGNPLQLVETAAYTVTLKMAVSLNIPLVIFGENPEYEYGTTEEDGSSGNDYIVQGLPYGIFQVVDPGYWEPRGIAKSELNAFIPPSQEDLNRVKPNVIFLSYFIPWSSTRNHEVARQYGFTDLTHEWKREGHIEDFEQIDCVAYPVHFWLKYPKFGFQRVSDVASRYVREGILSLDEAKKLIAEHDHELDQRALEDFCKFCRYTPRQFWDIVDRFWNREIFEEVGGIWKMK